MDATDEWPAQVLSGDDAAFPWPHGAAALIAERKRVQDIEGLRSTAEYGYRRGGAHDLRPNLFTFPMSLHEALVRSDTERIAMQDRVRGHYNDGWKQEATAEGTPRLAHAMSSGQLDHFKQQFRFMKNYAREIFAKRIDDATFLQALTAELKPETLELAERCTGTAELLRRMLDAKA
jgi:hypothetical protein